MPHVCFEACEMTYCSWCGCVMVRSIVELVCVDCSMRFTERLHPSTIWREPMAEMPIVSIRDKDFADSAFERPDDCISYTSMINTKDSVIAFGNGGSFDFDTGCNLTMYDKFADAFKYSETPFLVEEYLWAEFVRSDSLSNCWVGVAGGLEIVQLSLPEFQFLIPHFIVEAPLGFFIINCTTQTCFHICNLGRIERCGLRSACHHLRNYPRQVIGFVLTQSEHNSFEEVSIIQCGISMKTVCDRRPFHIAQLLLDRMMKIIIGRFDHVVFRRCHSC